MLTSGNKHPALSRWFMKFNLGSESLTSWFRKSNLELLLLFVTVNEYAVSSVSDAAMTGNFEQRGSVVVCNASTEALDRWDEEVFRRNASKKG